MIEWTSDDSVYGARHLAQLWSEVSFNQYYQGCAKASLLSASSVLGYINALVLLDLLGAPRPIIHDYHHADTGDMYHHITLIEERLSRLQILHYTANAYFMPHANDILMRQVQHMTLAGQVIIDDDHRPFFERDVSVLHIVPAPFPNVWHTIDDDRAALDMDIVLDFSRILAVFLNEYLLDSCSPIPA
jgi:glutaminyl-peptide cyclotransferase